VLVPVQTIRREGPCGPSLAGEPFMNTLGWFVPRSLVPAAAVAAGVVAGQAAGGRAAAGPDAAGGSGDAAVAPGGGGAGRRRRAGRAGRLSRIRRTRRTLCTGRTGAVGRTGQVGTAGLRRHRGVARPLAVRGCLRSVPCVPVDVAAARIGWTATAHGGAGARGRTRPCVTYRTRSRGWDPGTSGWIMMGQDESGAHGRRGPVHRQSITRLLEQAV
jgi:hypothetical protein